MWLPTLRALNQKTLLDRKSHEMMITTRSRQIRLGKRKAISNVVTTAILLAAVSTLGVFVLVWSSTSLMQERQEMERVFSTQINKLNEDILFENVWFITSPTKKVNVTVTNVGSLGTNVTEINFINSTTYAQFLGSTYTAGGLTPYQSFSKNITYSWTSGKAFNIEVITNRGNIFLTQVTPP